MSVASGGAQRLGTPHLHLRATSSTNDRARELAVAGAPHGTIVTASEQSAGRGRQGRTWSAPPGHALLLSIVIRNPPDLLPLAAGLAVARALGEQAAIKWPNDVLVDRKKVAGTLVECVTAGDRVEHVILGTGVNLNVTREMLAAGLGAESRAAGSLRSAAGREIDRNAFAAVFLGALETWFRTYRDHGPKAILAAWADRDIVGGRRVEEIGRAHV